MTMYKIVFVDEQKEDIEDFLDYVEKTSTKEQFEVIVEYPEEEMEDMLSTIIKHNPDAIITDYMLNENKEQISYNVPYTGVELVRAFTELREDFPCFVMTSYDDQAIGSTDDVNIVYIKGLMHGSDAKSGAKASFLQRVESQIVHYRAKIANAENELIRLIKLREEGKANAEDESKLIELDHFLESAIDKKSAIPKEFKELSNEKKLDSLLSKVDLMLKRLDDE